MTVEMRPRIINGTSYDMPTVNGMDRCQINTRLHYLNVEMDKLKAKQAALIDARDQLIVTQKFKNLVICSMKCSEVD